MSVTDVLGEGLGHQIYEAVSEHLGDSAQLRVSRTQVGWAKRRGFAFLWSAQRWQGPSAAPVVLTLAFTSPDPSPRWKEVFEVRQGLWNHHLEVHNLSEIDEQVLGWLDRAAEEAA